MPKFMTLANMMYPVFASTPPRPDYVDASDWATVITNVVGQFSVANIVAVIASVVLAGIGFVFLWWGVRLAFNSIMGAVKRGSLSINSRRGRRR